MKLVFTSFENLKKNDPISNVTKMNDTTAEKFIWMCLLDFGLLSKLVFEKRENIKAENVTSVKVCACVEEVQMKIIYF